MRCGGGRNFSLDWFSIWGGEKPGELGGVVKREGGKGGGYFCEGERSINLRSFNFLIFVCLFSSYSFSSSSSPPSAFSFPPFLSSFYFTPQCLSFFSILHISPSLCLYYLQNPYMHMHSNTFSQKEKKKKRKKRIREKSCSKFDFTRDKSKTTINAK